MPPDLPPFRPLRLDEMRVLWTRYPEPHIQRLILEVVRSREVIAEIDHLYKVTHQAWRDTNGGNLMALHLLQQLLNGERERLAF